LALLLLFILPACEHDPLPGPSILKKWDNIEMRASYEVPAPAGRDEEGEASLELLSDNSLAYNFHVHNLKPGDVLTNAHIHYGHAGMSGGILVPLNPAFVGAGATGVVKNLRQGQIDTLLNHP